MTVSYQSSALGWARLVRALGASELPIAVSVAASLKSSIYAYLPGRVWNLSARAYMLKDYATDWRPVTLALGLEQVVNLVIAGVLAGIALPSLFLGRPEFWGLLVLGLFASDPKLVCIVVNPLLRLIGRAPVDAGGLCWRERLLYSSLLVVQWCLLGFGVVAMMWALGISVRLDQTLMVTGALAGSFVGGYLALIAPAGLGVREVLLATLLAPLLPGQPLLLIAIVARLVSVVSAVLHWGLGALIFWQMARAEADRP